MLERNWSSEISPWAPFPGIGPVDPSLRPPGDDMISGFGPLRLLIPADGPDTAVTVSIPLAIAVKLNVPISMRSGLLSGSSVPGKGSGSLLLIKPSEMAADEAVFVPVAEPYRLTRV